MEKKLKKGKKVTVLGAGNVGLSIVFSLAIKGLCSELLLIDITKPTHAYWQLQPRENLISCDTEYEQEVVQVSLFRSDRYAGVS